MGVGLDKSTIGPNITKKIGIGASPTFSGVLALQIAFVDLASSDIERECNW